MHTKILKKILDNGCVKHSKPCLADMNISQDLITDIYNWANSVAKGGALASYIPELLNVNPKLSAICIGDLHNNKITVGNGAGVCASFQSVIKPFLYIYALEQGFLSENISSIEPTAMRFNSDAVLMPDSQKNRPGHPMNNAGAISSAGAIQDFEDFLDFMRKITNNPDINILENVFESEMSTNSNNRALAYRLASTGRFSCLHESEKALENYTRACSIGGTVEDITNAGLIISSGGYRNKTKIVKTDNTVRAINAMNSYGLYEHTGEISLLAAGARALSCKSGVSGFILNIDPLRGAFCTYSPKLDSAGNSMFGKYALIPLNNILAAENAMRLSPDEIIRSLKKNNM